MVRTSQGFGQKALGGHGVALGREEKVERRAGGVHRTVEVAPLALGSVATLQSPRDRLVGCSSWPLRFAVYSSGGQFEPEVILLAVGWYLRFSLFLP